MNPRLLPRITTREEYLRSPRDEGTYREAVRTICRLHAPPEATLRKYTGGSTIVFAVGDTHVVKLFEPIFERAARVECATLEAIRGRLGVPTPTLLAAGEMEGWHYLVMEQLQGEGVHERWNTLAPEERARVCYEVGQAAARLHALDPPAVEELRVDWEVFLADQAGTCVQRQRAHGLAPEWLEQIPSFLEGVELSRGISRRVLLHTEIMREHLLMRPGGVGWKLSGLFDFEPAMIGTPEYEFASVGIFLAGGEPGLFASFLDGYGLPERERTGDLQERILACALLHRYSNLRWYLERVPPRTAWSLGALAREWWPLD